MKSVFKDVYFGNKFVTRNGRDAIYVGKGLCDGLYKDFLVIEGSTFTWAYNPDGTLYSEIDKNFDIIKKEE